MTRGSRESSILIVDDSVSNLRTLSSMLRRRGYKARPAPSGKLALRACEAEPPDLVLLDIIMPEMDGYEVCRALKANAHLKDIPVIFLSALGETFDKVKAFEAGAVDYITKPFHVEEVHARVETHIALRLYQRELLTKNQELVQANEELRKSQAALHLLAGRLLAKQDEERRQTALHVHDDVTQNLVALSIEAWQLEQDRRAPRSASAPALQHLRERIEQLAAEAQVLSNAIHPSVLDHFGLASAVENECRAVTEREKITIRFESQNLPGAIPRRLALCLYRVVQESLRNMAEHARASQGQVSLSAGEGGITATIADDGVGLDPETVRRKRALGIAAMEQRMRLIGGTFSITSGSGHGTKIVAWAPLKTEVVEPRT